MVGIYNISEDLLDWLEETFPNKLPNDKVCTIEEIRFLKNEMLLISESRNKKHNDVIIADIEKQLDQAWEGNISSQNFVDTVTKIFTGYYYDKSN